MPVEECCVDLDLGELPEEVAEYARVNLGESPETRLKSIQDLRDMIYERGECTPQRMDDAFLLRFLRARYFIVERAHRLFVNYCTFKEDNPDIQNNVEPLALRFIGDANVLCVPPYRDQDGRRWMMYRIGNWDPSAYSVEELFKATLVVLELGILEQRAQVLGGVCLFDFENLSMQHAWQVTPSVASKVVQLMVTCFPIKTHALHIINQSWVFDTIYSMFKPLLDDRMRQKIFFHGNNMESLHKHVSPKYLPERYGGTRPDVSYTLWLDSLKSKPNIVKEMESLGYKFDPKDIPNETKPDDEPKKITNDAPVDAIKEMDKSIAIKE